MPDLIRHPAMYYAEKALNFGSVPEWPGRKIFSFEMYRPVREAVIQLSLSVPGTTAPPERARLQGPA